MLDEGFTDHRVWHIQFDADHQTATAHLLDVRAADVSDTLHQVVTYDTGILHQSLFLEHIEYGEGGSAGQVIATKGGSQLSIDGLELWRDQHSAHGETIGDTLGHGDDVWLDAQPLVSEELSASSVAALDFIADQHGTIALTGIGQSLSELRRSHLNAAHTLDTLQNNGCYASLR